MSVRSACFIDEAFFLGGGGGGKKKNIFFGEPPPFVFFKDFLIWVGWVQK